jgi:hypothetical protein
VQVLKRYKAERDELRVKTVQTVEIAVKQAQEDMQEKLDASTEELKNFANEIQALKDQLADEIEKRSISEKMLANVSNQLQMEKDEIIDCHKKAIEKYDSDISAARSISQEVKEQAEKRDNEYDELQKQMTRMQELHKEEIELVKCEAREQIMIAMQNEVNALQTELSTAQVDKNNLEMKFSELELRFGETLAKSQTDKLDGDRRVAEIQTRHRKEIDELTAELDLFEAENEENIRKLQESLKDKEAVISAMGSQLAEAESRFSTTIENQQLLHSKIEDLQGDLKKAKEEKAATEQEITKQIILKEKAIEDVANELTAKAEEQFEERNELYRVLKKKFDEATSKISILERDVRFAKKELDELKKRQEAREADLKDELAQAKASIAKSEANLARAEKNHRAELQLSQDELDASKATSQQIQKSLAVVVHEKEKLAAEVVDLKNISEELMAMVEERGLA